MTASNNRYKKLASMLGLISNSVLTILKFIVGCITGSPSIISEAVHSSTDVLASVMSYMSIRASSKPADSDHPWGHGKIEDMSSVVESLLVLLAGGLILYRSISVIINPREHPVNVIGTSLMFFCALTNLLLSMYVSRIAKRTDSSILAADSLHLRTDSYSAGGVGVGLLLSSIFGMFQCTKWLTLYIDPAAAAIVAIVMIIESREIIASSISKLIDGSLPDNEKSDIRCYLRQRSTDDVSCRLLRTRKSGSKRFIEIGVTVPGEMVAAELVKLMDEMSRHIGRHMMPGSDVSIKLKLGDR